MNAATLAGGAARVALLLTCLAGGAGCSSLATPASTPTPGAAVPGTLEIPAVAYRERTLANGLQVISVESHASPTVGVQVWYHVGARDDPPGRSGFAHLFEHLMFKGSRYLKPEQFERMTDDIGGANNAFTTDDVTAYHEVVPSNHLEMLLWAEAERLSNLNVDEANFKSERAVVEEEYRQRVLASPYGRLFNGLISASYLQHPYKRPPIGNMADLEAANLSDVVAFHARYYRPDNATLVVTGDFDPKQLDAWVDKYFAIVPRPATPLPHEDAREPAWTADRVATLTAPRVPLPAVAYTWLAPTVRSADAPALQVAAAVLSAGDSSRLNQALVYRQQLTVQAGFDADLRAGPGLLIAYAIVAGGKSPADAGEALLAEVRRLAAEPPSAAELAKVKNQLITAAFSSRQTPIGLGSAIAEAAVLEGDPARVNTDLDDLQRVSGADVQRVMRQYVLGAHKVSLTYRQEEAPK
ncbi:MAG: pitrilysin family protein [Caldimonas sp.]